MFNRKVGHWTHLPSCDEAKMNWVSTFSSEATGSVRDGGTAGPRREHSCSLLAVALSKQRLLLPQKNWMLRFLVPTTPAHPQTLRGGYFCFWNNSWCHRALGWKHEECFPGGYPGRWGTPQSGLSETLFSFSNQKVNSHSPCDIKTLTNEWEMNLVSIRYFLYREDFLPERMMYFGLLALTHGLGVFLTKKHLL